MTPFRLLTFAAFAAVTLPRLAHRGMFVDGVTYASIARNLAEGWGSFWSPSYTANIYPRFHEHPPLGFWLQSWWFRTFGDHLFVERLYALTIALGTAGLMVLIWRRVHAGPAQSGEQHVTGDLEWVAILLWIAVPVVSFALVGNLLETTVALFTTAACWAALNAVAERTKAPPFTPRPQAETRAWTATGWSVISGLCVVAAGLTKGPVGLFPLAAPIAFLRLPGGRHVWRSLVAQWITVGVCALLLWTSGDARASLTEYLTQQLVPALAGQREVSGSLTILKTLLQGVILPMAGACVLAVGAARRFALPSRSMLERALLFFLLGLAGTLPILASAKQAGHYLVPAVPLFAVAAALFIGPTVGEGIDRLGTARRRRAINIVSAVLALGTLAASLSPAIGRDRQRLADLDALASTVPQGQTIGICPESNDDWGLHAWFERRFHVSLDAAGGQRRDWFLWTARAGNGCLPATCAAVTDAGRQLVLMKCRRAD